MAKKFVVFSLVLISLWAKETPKEELARVGVLKFTDATGLSRLGYMPHSLQEAIDNSLQKRFEYRRQDRKLLDQVMEKKAPQAKELSPAQALDICKETKTDVLVYGHFVYNSENNELTIFPKILVSAQNRFISLKSIKNPIDDSLFAAVDLVAQEIVLAMLKLAQETEKEPEKSGIVDDKAKITTQSIKQDRALNWAVPLHAGSLFSLGEIAHYLGHSFGPKIGLQRLIEKNWLLGLQGQLYSWQLHKAYSKETNSFDMSFFSLSVGYLIPLPKNFSVSANLFSGISLTNLKENSQKYYEPFGGISLALRYSLLRWLALETEWQTMNILSKPKSLWITGVSLGSVVFF